MNSLTRIFAILHKELLQLGRDKLTFGMIVGIPLIQLMMFGYAINTDVRGLPAAYVDQADSSLSREYLSDLGASQVIELGERLASVQELDALFDGGTISIGIVIPADFDRRVIGGIRAPAQLLIDGSDSIIFGVAGQLASISPRFDSQLKVDQPARVELRNYYNPNRRTAVNIVPGLVGVILTMTIVLFTAVAIVRERERGNLELLINTTIRTWELMLGKIAPYVVIGLIQLMLILMLGRIVFDVPLHGSRIDLLIASGLFIAANLALGLLVSTVVQTQFQAMQMTFFFFLPSILLSGFMFPFAGMPPLAQSIAELLPLTHYNRLIRGILLRGADISSLTGELIALSTFLIVTLSLAIRRFRKRLD